MSKENVPVSSQQSVNAPGSGRNEGASQQSQHSVTAPASDQMQGSSKHSMKEEKVGSSQYSMNEEIAEEEEGDEDEEEEEEEDHEEESQHSMTVPSLGQEDKVPSEDIIISPYDTKDKDFVNAKAFLLQASTLTGLNL